MDLKRLEDAYRAQDATRVRRASDEVVAAVGCLGEVVPFDVAARVHRDLGLRAWLDRGVAGTLAPGDYFAAARNLDPDHTFPQEMVSREDAVYREYVSVPVGDTRASGYAPPRGFEATFDGLATGRRPTAWPTILQLTSEGDGVVVFSDYLYPNEVPATQAFDRANALRARRHAGLVVTGSGLLLGGVGAAVLATNLSFAQSHGECFSAGYTFNDNGTCAVGDDLFPDERTRSGIYSGAALAAVGGVGAVAGGVTFLLGRDSLALTLTVPH